MTQSDTDTNGPSISAYILLSEPLHFNTTEIEEALLQDYPSLDIRPETALSMAQSCDTDQFITTPLLLGAGGADTGIISLIRLPGYGTWDPDQLTPWQRLRFPDVTDALAKNASYICVSVGNQGDDDTAKFRAARLCSCLTALFAKLPIALAVYWEPADHFLRPADAVAMADRALADDFPMDQWVGLSLGRAQHEGIDLSSGITRGLQHLKGVEVSLAAAPVDLETAANMLVTTSAMLTSYGHTFKDGDTLGHEGQPPEESLRIRRIPQGVNDSVCDVWLLVHPQSPVDHNAILGPTNSQPAPEGETPRMRSQMGFFKRLIRGGRDA